MLMVPPFFGVPSPLPPLLLPPQEAAITDVARATLTATIVRRIFMFFPFVVRVNKFAQP